MLNPFPDLLLFGVFAPLILRLMASFFLARLALRHTLRHEEVAAGMRGRLGRFTEVWLYGLVALEIIAAAFLFFGFLTQIGALLALAAVIEIKIIRKYIPSVAGEGKSFYTLLAVVLFTLLLSGAGPFAVDLPL